MLDIVVERDIYKVMLHVVYYAKSLKCSSCLEGSHWRSLRNWVTVPGSLE